MEVKMMKKALLSAVLGCALSAASAVCHARTVRETTYRYQQIWSTAVRFLRVDNGFEIQEQDKETGYVLFSYPDAGRSLMGSVELVSMVRSNKKYITVALRIQDMPSYVEIMLIDKLVRKLKDEYGEPPAPQSVGAKRDKAPSDEKPSEDEATEKKETEDKSAQKAKDENEEYS
jgi:hypothetical protein